MQLETQFSLERYKCRTALVGFKSLNQYRTVMHIVFPIATYCNIKEERISFNDSLDSLCDARCHLTHANFHQKPTLNQCSYEI